MLSDQLLQVIACPKCNGVLNYVREDNSLTCHTCCLQYDIKDNIPTMLIEEAETLNS